MSHDITNVFNQYNEIEFIAKLFSKHFHYNSWSPDFYINDIKKSGAYWDIYPTEDGSAVKRMSDFLRNSHMSPRLKKFIYYKAERANQDVIVSEILAHYFLKHINEIHYQQQKIIEIGIQSFVVVGHKNPYDQEQEIYLLKNKQPISIVYLKTESGQTLYIDLCATQLDINSFDDHGMPYLLLTEIHKNKLYAPKSSNAIKVIEIKDLIVINDDSHYQTYLQNLVNTKENDGLEDDEKDYLQNYHERLESDFEKFINKQKDKIDT